jgi:3-keto-disaccharide hydrolase
MRYLLAGLGAVMLAGGLCGAWEDQPLIRLFDGKTLAGWAPEHTDRFVVRDGRLVQEGGAGWLRSEKTFKNFELHAEVRMLKEGAETGILFRASRESTGKDPHWPVRSYQLQINDGDANLVLLGHGMMAPRFDRKSESLKQALKAPGEWQKIILNVKGPKLEVILNGLVITTSSSLEVVGGHLGLLGRTGSVQWRELTVREFP